MLEVSLILFSFAQKNVYEKKQLKIMETKCIIGTVLFSAGTFIIGYYLGKSQSEKELKPRVDDHLERIKYLENGITKN